MPKYYDEVCSFERTALNQRKKKSKVKVKLISKSHHKKIYVMNSCVKEPMTWRHIEINIFNNVIFNVRTLKFFDYVKGCNLVLHENISI